MTFAKRVPKKAVAMTLFVVMVLCLVLGALSPSASAATISCYDTGYRYNPGAPGLPYEFAAHWGLAYAYSSNGMPAYCIEMLNHEFYGGTDYYETTSPIGNLSGEQRAMLAQVLAHGYDGSTKYGGSAVEEQLATQRAVWMVATNNCWGGRGSHAILHGLAPHTTLGHTARRIIDSCNIYIQLSLAITHQALSQSCASRRKTVSTNEKYTFRTWLLRLGLNGDEFKTARMHLLEHLDGNIAWKRPEQAVEQRERLRQKAELVERERPALQEQRIEAEAMESLGPSL